MSTSNSIVSEAGNDLILESFEAWDGIDEGVATKIWPVFEAQIRMTAKSLQGMMLAAANHPKRFAALLKINKAPFMINMESKTLARDGVVALCLSIFSWIAKDSHIVWRILTGTDNSKGPSSEIERRKRVSKNGKYVRWYEYLEWTIHCILKYMPNMYFNIRRAYALLIACLTGHLESQVSSIVNLALDSSANQKLLRQVSPFGESLTMIRCFGGHSLGFFLEGNGAQLSEVRALPSVERIVKVLDCIDGVFKKKHQHLDGKQLGQVPESLITMTPEDAAEVASSCLGIHPVYWIFSEGRREKKTSTHDFSKLYEELVNLWEHEAQSTTKERKAAVLALRDKFIQERKFGEATINLGQDVNQSTSDTESEISYLHAPRPTDMEAKGMVERWLNENGVKPPSKPKAKQRFPATNFPQNTRRQIMNAVASLLVEKLNRSGQHVDEYLAAGKLMWEQFGQNSREDNNNEVHPPLRATIRPLGNGGTPSIILIENAFTQQFLKQDRAATNNTRFCKDEKSDGGSSSIASFFHCKKCIEKTEFVGPLMKLGAHNSIASTDACLWQRGKMDMVTEMVNMVINGTNLALETICKRLSEGDVSNQPPDGGQEGMLTDLAGTIILSCEEIDSVVNSVLGDNSIQLYANSYELVGVVLAGDLAKFPMQNVNCNICKVGSKAKYGLHQDSSWTLNSALIRKASCAANEDTLPVRGDMLVVTFVTGLGDCQAKLSWEREGRPLLQVTTTGNCIHWQLAGVQDEGIQHQSDFIDKKGAVMSTAVAGTRCVRKVDTFRMVACPACDAETYRRGILLDNLGETKRVITPPFNDYKRMNVFGNITEVQGGGTIVPILDGCSNFGNGDKKHKNQPVDLGAGLHVRAYEGEFEIQKLPKKPTPEIYKFLMEKTFVNDNRDIRKIQPMSKTVGMPQKYRREMLIHHEFVAKADEHGVFFHIVDSSGSPVMDQPLFMMPSKDGQFVPLVPGDTFAYHQLPINHNKQQTSVVMSEMPGLISPSHAYKNNPQTFRKWIDLAKKIKMIDPLRKDLVDGLKIEYDAAGPLTCNGFAGSMQKADNKVPTPSMLRGGATVKAAFSQKSNNQQNSIFNKNRESGRAIAVFVCERTFWRISSENATDDKDDVIFVGYFYIARQEVLRLTPAQIEQRFQGEGSYVASNKFNLSHMLEDFFQYHLEPVFSWKGVMRHKDLLDRVKNQKEPGLDPLVVWVEDTRPLCADYKDVKTLVEGITSPEQVHISQVTETLVRHHLCSGLDRLTFIEQMQSPIDENRQFQPTASYVNSLSIHDCVVILMHVMVAAAMRFNAQNCTSVHDGDIYCTPLLCRDELPDSLRLSPLPCPNGDLDVISQFILANCRALLEVTKEKDNSFTLDYSPSAGNRSVAWNSTIKKSAADVGYVCNCLFFAVVARFTGNVNMLSLYSSLAAPGCQLPVVSEWDRFASFLTKLDNTPSKQSIFSLQHLGMVPKEMKSSRSKLMLFLQTLSSSDVGFPKLHALLDIKLRKGKAISRTLLVTKLMEILDKAGDIQGEEGKLLFLSNKIVCDIEGMLPGYVQDVGDIRVALGWGSTQGIECVNLARPDGTRYATSNPMEKVIAFYEAVRSLLLNDDTPEEFVIASGWERRDNSLFSIWGGREFSLLDAEHALCKIWLAVMHSTSCRNISEIPKLSVNHCYPLPPKMQQAPWTKPLAKTMDRILAAFKLLPISKFKFHYPDILLLPGERHALP